MVLESHNRVCNPKINPASPTADNIPAESPFPFDRGTIAGGEEEGLRWSNLTQEIIARRIPVLFHPPLSPFIIGQIGLFAQNAILATLDAIKPNPKTSAHR
jgi:hypothetical protein